MVFKNGTEKFLVLALLISRWFVLTSVPEQSPGLRSPAVKINTVFFWYLMHRLNTRELLQRRNFLITYDMCVLWLSPVVETRTHLFFHCTFARACRNYICPNWDPPSDNIHGIVGGLLQYPESNRSRPLSVIQGLMFSGTPLSAHGVLTPKLSQNWRSTSTRGESR
jgi:hypothetical protein